MRITIRSYVGAVVVGALACGWAVFRAWPNVAEGSVAAVAVLSLLAVVAEVLAVLLPFSAKGSIAFIPYFAAILVAPGWQSLVAVAAVKLLVEAISKQPSVKAIFNSGQHALFLGVAILVYRQLGGGSLLELRQTGLLAATVADGVPAIVAFAISYLMNSLLVSGAIALSSGLSMDTVWHKNHVASLGLDLLSVPVIFVFAWVYASYGAIAAATLWVPILGLRQVHKMNLELERTNEELLELMVKSMEARDPYTSGHSRRVQHYSTLIARALGLGERDVNLASRAALLHDVGKIHEKYGPILAKSDRLSPEEWAIIQAHPIDGANLVSTMSRLRDAVGPIRHHHENWDGTGYPDGLAGELIPLASRIIRFADTIDAMTTDRPYRASLTEAQVRAEVVKCRGKQFDPVITDRLLSSSQWNQLFAAGDASGWGRPELSLVPDRRSVAS